MRVFSDITISVREAIASQIDDECAYKILMEALSAAYRHGEKFVDGAAIRYDKFIDSLDTIYRVHNNGKKADLNLLRKSVSDGVAVLKKQKISYRLKNSGKEGEGKICDVCEIVNNAICILFDEWFINTISYRPEGFLV